MRKAKYCGNSCSVGRFGAVSKGDVLDLTEYEAGVVADSKEFILLREQKPDGFPDACLPPKGKYFDMSKVRWEEGLACKDVGKMRKSALIAAIMQLEACGFPAMPVAKADVNTMRDFVLQTARHAGWV